MTSLYAIQVISIIRMSTLALSAICAFLIIATIWVLDSKQLARKEIKDFIKFLAFIAFVTFTAFTFIPSSAVLKQEVCKESSK